MYRILINGWNCGQWAERCLRSAVNQIGEKKVYVYNDGSTDKTHRICQRFYRRYGIQYSYSSKNKGAAYARWQLLQNRFQPEDVIVLLDMDDWLPQTDVLQILDRYYEEGAEVTLGRHQRSDGTLGPYRFYTQGQQEKRSYRTTKWKAFPLRTFKAKLLHGITKDHFIKEGKWIQTATDVALMFPILERATPGTVKHPEEVTYIFTDRKDSSFWRYGMDQKMDVNRWVIKEAPH